ncbi:MAG: DUF4838 domain-containing protein [Armatimonadetes bacterium]|nr:DUF4838 domain-containing protein [Armatimonadota bacterium]
MDPLMATALVLLAAAPADKSVELARDGKARATLVVAEEAIAAEKTAATELAAYLKKVTGAEFTIQGRPGPGTNILLGRSREVERRLPRLDWRALGSDGIVIRTVGDDLVLSGGRPRGTLYAVYTFLQDVVGCRWYASDAEEVIPNQPTLVVPRQEVVYRPPFDYRHHYTAALTDPRFCVKLRQNGREFMEAIPEAYGGDVRFGSAHTLLRQFLKADDHFQAHPEWYAYDKEKKERTPKAVCLTEPGAHAQVTQEVLAYLKRHPDTRILSVSCDDTNAACQCERCVTVRQREGSESGPLLMLVNAVAERVEKEHPDVLISTLAYWHTDRPPATLKPRRNVLIHLGVLDRNHKHAIPDVPHFSRYLKRWGELTPHVYIWDYDAHFGNFIQPHPNHTVLAKSLRFYRDQKVSGVFVQGSWGETGEFMHLRAWLSAQLMWNPDQDERALMTEFLNGYYGAAGPHLLAYLDLISNAVNRQPTTWLGVYDGETSHWLTLEDLNAATRLFEKAEAAVAGNDTLTYRVRRARFGIDTVWVQRYRELRRTARAEGRTFLGPEDPYAALERIAANEFKTDTFREWGPFSEYVARLRTSLPPREGSTPPECDRLKPYEWEDLQETALVVSPNRDHGSVVDDPAASNGKALKLVGGGQELEARLELPAHLEGRWRVYVVARAQPKGEQPAGIALGIYNPRELCRLIGEFSPAEAGHYRTFDLGVRRLTPGAKIWVQPSGAGSFGEVEATWIDRVFLIAAE